MLPDDPRHGTVNGYTNVKCRCDRCRKAWRAVVNQYKKDRIQRLMHNPKLAEHGKYTTYANWGCRCEPCKTAWKTYYAAKKEAKKNALDIIKQLNNDQQHELGTAPVLPVEHSKLYST